MLTVLGYFGVSLPDKYNRGDKVRVGRLICRVVYRIGYWHWLKKIK